MADVVWAKEAFSFPRAPVHPYPVLPQLSEQPDESQGQCEFAPQCGLSQSQSPRSRFFDETYLFWAYQPLIFLVLLPVGGLSRLISGLALLPPAQPQ